MPFAITSLGWSPTERAALINEQEPPDALPAQAYDEMVWQQPSPPVTSRYSYRPVVSSNGPSTFSDWDLVWIRPRFTDALRYGAIGIIDSWYPATFMRAVREFLRGATSVLLEPSATELLAVHVAIAESRLTLAPDEHVLLASRLIASSSSHYDEQFEIWSENGNLLLEGQILRRATPTRPRPPPEQPSVPS